MRLSYDCRVMGDLSRETLVQSWIRLELLRLRIPAFGMGAGSIDFGIADAVAEVGVSAMNGTCTPARGAPDDLSSRRSLPGPSIASNRINTRNKAELRAMPGRNFLVVSTQEVPPCRSDRCSASVGSSPRSSWISLLWLGRALSHLSELCGASDRAISVMECRYAALSADSHVH